MTRAEYFITGEARRRELARTHGFFFFGFEALRHAAVMALLLEFVDLFSRAFYSGEPWQRIRFVVGFALLMAGVQLWRLRHAGPDAPGPASRAS